MVHKTCSRQENSPYPHFTQTLNGTPTITLVLQITHHFRHGVTVASQLEQVSQKQLLQGSKFGAVQVAFSFTNAQCLGQDPAQNEFAKNLSEFSGNLYSVGVCPL